MYRTIDNFHLFSDEIFEKNMLNRLNIYACICIFIYIAKFRIIKAVMNTLQLSQFGH